MSERLGPMTFGKRNGQVFLGRDFGHERDYSENIATAIDEEVSEIISKQYSRVKELLLAHRPHLNAIVKVLLEKETLDRAEVEAIMDEVNRKLAAGEDPDSSSPDSPDNDSNSNEPPAVIVTREEEKVPVKETKPERDGGDSSPGLTPKFA
ncbi:MAG: ATP-dependent zinc metalloprotease FtsH 3 [bacterium ADurb.Bin425]|nr:MAG: ATP-dependent zinc metalloprotease FtsH 3 [bacterium ADurb.Bin425]